ncbi:hypothetical protein OH76DRAFT_1489673 [Lentinus brumalis]|uniref:Uncharacterized protein n=1 Tax=Lentinus brumalis TaxID=2498619 RepID=A0A371CLM3_9APHY|nr:hypothetical protein OH76DRAFT_1489673 [Polyporus brumalis]
MRSSCLVLQFVCARHRLRCKAKVPSSFVCATSLALPSPLSGLSLIDLSEPPLIVFRFLGAGPAFLQVFPRFFAAHLVTVAPGAFGSSTSTIPTPFPRHSF